MQNVQSDKLIYCISISWKQKLNLLRQYYLVYSKFIFVLSKCLLVWCLKLNVDGSAMVIKGLVLSHGIQHFAVGQ